MFLNNLEFSKIMKTAKNRLLRDLKSYKVGTMSLKSIDFTADQKLNKWDFINDDSAKNMVQKRIKIPNKKHTNMTKKQTAVLTNQKRRIWRQRPMRRKQQFRNFQKKFVKK